MDGIHFFAEGNSTVFGDDKAGFDTAAVELRMSEEGDVHADGHAFDQNVIGVGSEEVLEHMSGYDAGLAREVAQGIKFLLGSIPTRAEEINVMNAYSNQIKKDYDEQKAKVDRPFLH